jgi:protease YdgD
MRCGGPELRCRARNASNEPMRRRIRLGWIVARLAPLLLLATVPPPHARLPGVGSSDTRTPVDITQPPWSGVLRLLVPGVGGCTAILVAPRLALTAAHCLWIDRTGRYVQPEAIHLLSGYDRAHFGGLTLANGYRVAPGWDASRLAATRGEDAALVSLAAPLGKATQALRVLDGWPPPGTMVALPGFNRDRREAVEADLGCRIIAETRALLIHDCDATLGTSGAPLLIHGPDGVWRVAGMQVAVRPFGRGGVAVPAASLQALLGSPGERP